MAKPTPVVKCTDVDVSLVTIAPAKKLDNGGSLCYINYKGGGSIDVQLPTMKAPFGVSCFRDEKTGTEKFSLDLSFNELESNPEVAALYQMLQALDERVMDAALDNSLAWFKKRISSKEVLDALFFPSIKQPKDADKYKPTMKLPLKKDDKGNFTTKTYNSSQQEVDLNTLNTKGAAVTAIVQPTSVWIVGGKFGVSWRVAQLRVVPRDGALTDYAFIDDDLPPAAPAASGADADAGHATDGSDA